MIRALRDILCICCENWGLPHVYKYLSVADNARDAVLLHVSATSERQE